MNEDAIRRVVREAIARQVGTMAQASPQRETACAQRVVQPAIVEPDPAVPLGPWQRHVSHRRLPVSPGGAKAPCLIEPAVTCSHCGFCQSFGH